MPRSVDRVARHPYGDEDRAGTSALAKGFSDAPHRHDRRRHARRQSARHRRHRPVGDQAVCRARRWMGLCQLRCRVEPRLRRSQRRRDDDRRRHRQGHAAAGRGDADPRRPRARLDRPRRGDEQYRRRGDALRCRHRRGQGDGQDRHQARRGGLGRGVEDAARHGQQGRHGDDDRSRRGEGHRRGHRRRRARIGRRPTVAACCTSPSRTRARSPRST